MTSSKVYESSRLHRVADKERGTLLSKLSKVVPKAMGSSRSSGPRKLASVLASLVIGFAMATWLRMVWVPVGNSCNSPNSQRNDPFLSTPEPNHPSKNLLMVGVMTAAIFLETRAVAVNRTWAQTIPGQVAFFSSGASNVPPEWNLPVISLPGVTDAYPPQKKSFMMLKYMHDNFIDKYEWFMRADDDVYLRGDRMETFLRSLNSSHTYFIGQAGRGKVEELGLLHLESDDNFCMGGTGMVFSRATLRKMIPHVSYCLKNLWSTHEDVEVGRCIKKFAGIDCTWSYEMQTLFYNNYSVGDTAFTGDLQRLEVHNAITMHPVKRTPYLYRLHNYLQSVKINDLHMKITSQYREIQELKELLHEDGEESVTALDQDARRYGMPISLNQYIPDSHRDVIPWNFFSRYVYHCRHDSPRSGLTQSVRTALKDIVMQVMKLINSNSQKVGRTIEYKEILYGYSRVTPNRGADYILDLLLIYKKHRGTSRTLSVRRHAYLHQSFDRIEFKEEEDDYASNVPATGGFQSSLSIFGHKTNSDASSQLGRSPDRIKATIHFIMSLSGRLEIFQRFMRNYERVCLKTNENTKLLLILFKRATDDPSADIIKTLTDYQKAYPSKEMKIIQAQGDFSRGLALELGAGQYGPDALMFFVDVDMYLSQGFLNRCRMNTNRRKSVYFPVVFSQYSPDIVFGSEARQGSQLVINNDAGYFRHFGFGLVCLYHGDMNDVGGMNNAIVGWGMEDVDLYEKFVQSNMTIFRGPDTGLVHIYHPVICDPRLEAKQYQMCIGSRASTYGANMQLARLLQEMSHNKKGGKKPDSHEDEDYDGR